MNVLLCLAIAMAIGLALTRLAKIVGLPNVTAYLIAGLAMRYLMKLIGSNDFTGLDIVSNAALGFIAFSIGSSFKIKHIKEIGKSVVVITCFQAFATVIIVDCVLVALHFFGFVDLPTALCLGAIATATAPAATLMVVRQYNAKGPVTDILLPVVALDDAIGLIVFSVSLSVAKLLVATETPNVALMLLDPLREIVLSLVVGAAIGAALTFGMGFFHSRSNRLTSIICAVFLGTSLASLFNLSSLLLCMSIGAVMANFYPESEKMLDLTEHWTPVVFLLFFVISGAELDLQVLPTVGLLGVLYIVLRSLGKYFGARLGASVVHEEENVKKYLGVALLPQAGVAIGMSQIVVSALPEEYGTKIRAVVLCATLVYELVGPLLTKFVLTRAGEIKKGGEEPSTEPQPQQ